MVTLFIRSPEQLEGMMTVRTIDVREKIMARNDEMAAVVRKRFRHTGVTALNLVSSPGSGKTSILERTLEAIQDDLPIGIIAGDVETQNDADRLAVCTHRLVHAVVTGGACHLDARQVQESLGALDLNTIRLVFIENVGNLVCPASWDLGESAKVVVFSVTEGEDKPFKYPKIFRAARYVILNKVDLLPHVPFDIDLATTHARSINPGLRFFRTSALTGEGLDEWFEFLRNTVRQCCPA